MVVSLAVCWRLFWWRDVWFVAVVAWLFDVVANCIVVVLMVVASCIGRMVL